MYCRPTYLTDHRLTSSVSLLVGESTPTDASICRTASNAPSGTYRRVPPTPAPRRRRRLEDPIVSHASNYYVIPPRLHTRAVSPPVPTVRSIHRTSQPGDVLCDLFNLLDRPPAVKPRRRHVLHASYPSRPGRSIDQLTDVNIPMDNKKRKYVLHDIGRCQQEKKPYDVQLPSMHHYSQLKETRKSNQRICQGYASRKGFFRRVAQHYLCIPASHTDAEFSN
jgi:hypothetical protein